MTIRDALHVIGSDEARHRLVEFIQKAEKSLENEGEITVQLFQCSTQGEMAVYEEEYDFSEQIPEFALTFIEEAEKDAMAVGRGRVKYACRVKGRNHRMSFALEVPRDPHEDIDDVEELPDKRGLIAAGMRHTENAWKLALESAKTAADHQQLIIRGLRAENEAYRKREVELIKTFEELTSMKFARDLELLKISKGEQRKDQVAGMFMQHGVPALIAHFAPKLLGAKPTAAHSPNQVTASASPSQAQDTAASGLGPSPKPPQPGTPEVHAEPVTSLELMFEHFIKTFTPDQLPKIMTSGIFSDPQIDMFRDILVYVVERSEARDAANQPQASNGAPPAQTQQQPQPQP